MNKDERGLQGSQGGPPAGQSVLRVGEEHGLEIPFPTFEQTREYRRFVQVCEAARRYRYLVVCVGDRGVGKTWAAREYAQWAAFERLLTGKAGGLSSRVSDAPNGLLSPEGDVHAQEY